MGYLKQYLCNRPVRSIAALLFFLSAYNAHAESQESISIISVPMEIPLGDIAAYINGSGRLPDVLHRREHGQTCAEPQRACTKVPEFRGLKVTFKNRCVETTPRIDCTITEDVRREGPVRFSSDGNRLVVTQNITGSATVRGRGEIGRHIRQTVRARAEFTVSGQPEITPDWKPDMKLDLSHRWIDPPQFRLFNLFTVTLQGQVDPPLRNALQRFKNEILASELQKVDLKSEAERLWQAIQQPHPVTFDENKFFVHVEPLSIGLDGPRFDGGSLKARLALGMRIKLNENPDPPSSIAPLPNLTTAPAEGYDVVLPIVVGLDKLESQIKLPVEFELDGPVPATVTVSESRLSNDETGRLQAVLDVEARVSKWLILSDTVFSGKVTVSALPVLDPNTGVITFKDPTLAAGTPEEPTKLLGVAISTGSLGNWLLSELAYDSQDDISMAETALNAALNREIVPGLKVVGDGDLSVDALRLKDNAVELIARSTGDIRIEGFNPIKQ